MYISVSNIAFNISLVYLHVGEYNDKDDVAWMVLDMIMDELWHLELEMSDDMAYVEAGYMPDSPCAYINVEFTVTFKYVLEFESAFRVEQAVEYLYNLTNPKSYELAQNSSLERMNKDHNCSDCTLNNSASNICSTIPKVSSNSDQAFIKRKADYTCPYVVLSQEEHNNLTLTKIISSTAKSITRSNEYLVCVNDIKFDSLSQAETTDLLETCLTYVCFGMSTLSTLGFLVIFYRTPPMQTLPLKTIANLVASLFLAQSVYISSIGANDDALFCYIASVVQHYLWVCTYAWCVICAHHMCTVFRGIYKPQLVTTKRYIKYLCVGYISPLLLVAFFVIGDKCSCFPMEISYGGKVCFLNAGKLYGLDVPIIGMLLGNLIYFGIIIYCIHTKIIPANQKVSGARNSTFLVYVKISTIMGFSWLFGMLAKWTNLYIMWIIFTVINGLQGTFLFLVFACRRDVIVAMRQKGKHGNKSTFNSTRSHLSNAEAQM